MSERREIYTKFWQDNLDKLEEIHQRIDLLLSRLEEKYQDFAPLYKELSGEIDILSSIYSSYNNIAGKEELLKLSALIRHYRERYTSEGLDFDALQYLIQKIRALRDESFSDFPVLTHEVPGDEEELPEEKSPAVTESPFRWITFGRNGSWFIIPFEGEVHIARAEKLRNSTKRISLNGRHYSLTDPFASSVSVWQPPRLLVSVKNEVYAADSAGKRIYARHDIIAPKVVPFPNAPQTISSPGRVRIFGKNHILLVP